MKVNEPHDPTNHEAPPPAPIFQISRSDADHDRNDLTIPEFQSALGLETATAERLKLYVDCINGHHRSEWEVGKMASTFEAKGNYSPHKSFKAFHNSQYDAGLISVKYTSLLAMRNAFVEYQRHGPRDELNQLTWPPILPFSLADRIFSAAKAGKVPVIELSEMRQKLFDPSGPKISRNTINEIIKTHSFADKSSNRMACHEVKSIPPGQSVQNSEKIEPATGEEDDDESLDSLSSSQKPTMIRTSLKNMDFDPKRKSKAASDFLKALIEQIARLKDFVEFQTELPTKEISESIATMKKSEQRAFRDSIEDNLTEANLLKKDIWPQLKKVGDKLNCWIGPDVRPKDFDVTGKKSESPTKGENIAGKVSNKTVKTSRGQ
jgi:hypothetical protein